MACFAPISALANPTENSVHVTLPHFHKFTASLATTGALIVAFGSSSTQGTGASSPEHTWPSVMNQTLEHAWPWSHVRVLNRGKAGDDSNMMMERFGRDVMDEAPDLLIWQSGANDMLRGVQSHQFEDNMSKGIELALAAGSDVVLMGAQNSPRIRAAGGTGITDSVLARLSVRYRIGLVLRSRLQEEWEAMGTPETAMISADGLHYTDIGYALLGRSMALSIMDVVHTWPSSKISLARLPQR